ncbi:MAG: hypothetical protein ACE5FS_05250 [Paracoccaceae bacterium]
MAENDGVKRLEAGLKAMDGRLKNVEASTKETRKYVDQKHDAQHKTTLDWVNKLTRQSGDQLIKAKAAIDELGKEVAKRADAQDKHAEQAEKNVQTLVKKFDEIDKQSSDVNSKLKALESNLKTLESSGAVIKTYSDKQNDALEAKVVGWINKLTKQTGEALANAKKYIDKLESEDAKRTEARKKQAELTDKKLENLKKMMDEMEKRHVKLIDTSIKNYDKLIRKVISQEVAKAGKGRK